MPRAFCTLLVVLAVLFIARHWSAQYEWHVHKKAGMRAGLANDVIDAIRHHRTPAFTRESSLAIL